MCEAKQAYQVSNDQTDVLLYVDFGNIFIFSAKLFV